MNSEGAVGRIFQTPEEPPKESSRAHERAPTDASSGHAAHKAADAAGIIREWGKVYDLTATHCTCCGAPLRDAVSVTRGIGPECSRQHYDLANHNITNSMVEEALGFLYASGLDSKVKQAAKALKTKPRDLCNILVWWSAAHLNQTAVVLDCAQVVTALGFDALGDRLRERNTNVIITKNGEDYILRCRAKTGVIRNMRRMTEAQALPREGRFKYGWRFPANRRALVWAILGEDFGNQWATVPNTSPGPNQVVKIPPATWLDVRNEFLKAYAPPKTATPAQLPIVRPGQPGWLEVHTPYRNFAFVAELKAEVFFRNRTWDQEKGCWMVELRFGDVARKLVAKHFNGAV